MMTIKTKSQTTVDAYEFLEANKEKAFTLKEIAEALGVASNKVTGSVVALAKKEILTKSEVEVDGKPFKAYQWASPAEFVFEEVKSISDKGVQMLQYLQANQGADLTAAEIAADMGVVPIAVNGVINGLVKRGLAAREEATALMPDGTEKTVKFIVLTEEGKAYQF